MGVIGTVHLKINRKSGAVCESKLYVSVKLNPPMAIASLLSAFIRRERY